MVEWVEGWVGEWMDGCTLACLFISGCMVVSEGERLSECIAGATNRFICWPQYATCSERSFIHLALKNRWQNIL